MNISGDHYSAYCKILKFTYELESTQPSPSLHCCSQIRLMKFPVCTCWWFGVFLFSRSSHDPLLMILCLLPHKWWYHLGLVLRDGLSLPVCVLWFVGWCMLNSEVGIVHEFLIHIPYFVYFGGILEDIQTMVPPLPPSSYHLPLFLFFSFLLKYHW